MAETQRANGSVQLDDAGTALQEITSHLEGHGLDAVRAPGGGVQFSFAGNGIMLEHADGKLNIAIQAPTANGLLMLRESVARQLLEFAPAAIESLTWDDGGVEEGLPKNFRELTLIKRLELSSNMQRLTFATDNLGIYEHTGMHVRLFFQSHPTRPAVWPRMNATGVVVMPEGKDLLETRVYTLRQVRCHDGEVDIDFVIHDVGLATSWARRAPLGAKIGMMGPGGGFIPPQTDGLLIGGDITATPAIGRLLEALPEDASGHAFIVVPDGQTHSCFSSYPSGVAIHTLSESDCLVSRMQGVHTDTADISFGWFAGEFAQAQEMRQFFKSKLALKKGQHLSVAYWRAGHTGDTR